MINQFGEVDIESQTSMMDISLIDQKVKFDYTEIVASNLMANISKSVANSGKLRQTVAIIPKLSVS